MLASYRHHLHHLHSRTRTFTTIILVSLGLAACGGGGESGSADSSAGGEGASAHAAARAAAVNNYFEIWVNGPGTVTSSPAGINCNGTSECVGYFKVGSTVLLTAVAGAGSSVESWGGSCAGKASSCTVTMNYPRSVSTTFAATTGGTTGSTSCPTAPTTLPNSTPPSSVPAGTVTPEPDLTQAWPPAPGTAPGTCPAVPLVGVHTYNVGPGQHYTSLTEVPWLSLGAGDVVNIFYQATPYATKIALRASGTAQAPVIINGIPDASGNLPVITGNGAVTAADAIAQGFFTTGGGSLIEGLGEIVLYRGANDPYGYKSSYLTIQNVKITGAAPGNTFTNHAGVKTTYGQFTAGIYAVAAQNLTIQNDQITGNGLGVFVNDQNDLAGTSFFVTLRGNYIYNNGVSGSWGEHNVYVQGVRSLYEGNYIGQLIPNAQGASLKDRSSGPVVRYNYIVSAARAIDLVDSEAGSAITNNDPLYNMGWVYGNVVIDNFSNPGVSSGDLIHWGGDSGNYTQYHRGPLYFYNNTIVTNASSSQSYTLALFDLPTNAQSIVASNNVVSSTGSAIIDLLTNNSNNGTSGTLNLVNSNWLTPGYAKGAGTVNYQGTMVSGTPSLTSTYHLVTGSPAMGVGVPYPASNASLTVPATAANLQPTYQYTTLSSVTQPSYAKRSGDTDLGAFNP